LATVEPGTLRVIVTVALCIVANADHAAAQTQAPPRQPDLRQLEAAGLRALEGRHVRIVTDLASSPAVDVLPAVFDAAVPQWAAYFGVPLAELDDAHWQGFLVKDRDVFASLGLMPAERPEFLSGYANGAEFWLVEQPSDYYRRHLVLHEGTHAFMISQLGGAGAPWYMEGMAELLGTHEWRDGRLQLGVMPAHRDDVPMWGRIKLIREAVEAGEAWPLARVLQVSNRRSMDTSEYAWTWLLASLLDGHPDFQDRFRELHRLAADRQFNDKFKELFAEDWRELNDEWMSTVVAVDYGYDISLMAIGEAETAPVESASRRSRITADRGWQSAGWLLRGGQSYRISASGRYQLIRDGETWPCEPGGVTLEYYDGRPAGVLLGALRYVDPAGGTSSTFATPMAIGLERTITPERDAVLYVRVNDDPARVSSNRGDLNVRIESARDGFPHLAPGQ
jgi:hypothetical protein